MKIHPLIWSYLYNEGQGQPALTVIVLKISSTLLHTFYLYSFLFLVFILQNICTLWIGKILAECYIVQTMFKQLQRKPVFWECVYREESGPSTSTVNILKFLTLYSLLFCLKLFLMYLHYKILSRIAKYLMKWQTELTLMRLLLQTI